MILVLLGVGYGAVQAYNGAITRAEAAETENRQLKGDIARAEGQLDAANTRHEADLERIRAANDRQIANAERAARKQAKANAGKIAETSARDAEKYTRYVVDKALPRNIEAINCRSDLRTVNDLKACPITVR